MRHMSTRTTLWLTTFSVLAGLVLVTDSSSSAVVTGKQEIRWFAGPYQGNPDDPGIDRPQVLHPETVAPHERAEVHLPLIHLGTSTLTSLRLPKVLLDMLAPREPRIPR